ncbi:MAG: hypothetical protein AWU57_1632 [Marinobacter sp. T13-3]|nr:MAG: hypothetical protein AWU57_1632 [Marinobacter sp. T13-3]
MNSVPGIFLTSLIAAFAIGATYNPDGSESISDVIQNSPACSNTEPGWPKIYSCLQAIKETHESTTGYVSK